MLGVEEGEQVVSGSVHGGSGLSLGLEELGSHDLGVGEEAVSVLGGVGSEAGSLGTEGVDELLAGLGETLSHPVSDAVDLSHEGILSVEGLPDESLSLVVRNGAVDLLNGVPEDDNVVFLELIDVGVHVGGVSGNGCVQVGDSVSDLLAEVSLSTAGGIVPCGEGILDGGIHSVALGGDGGIGSVSFGTSEVGEGGTLGVGGELVHDLSDLGLEAFCTLITVSVTVVEFLDVVLGADSDSGDVGGVVDSAISLGSHVGFGSGGSVLDGGEGLIESVVESFSLVFSHVPEKVLLKFVPESLDSLDSFVLLGFGDGEAFLLLGLDSSRHGGLGCLDLLFNALVSVSAVAFVVASRLSECVGVGLKFEGGCASSDGGGEQ